VVAHAWREPLRVSEALRAEFPELGASASGPASGDVRRRVAVQAPHRPCAPLGAVVFLARGAADTLTRVAPRAALAALIRQSPWVMVDDGDAGQHLEALRRTAATVPAFRLEHTRAQLHAICGTLLGALA
jgi:hypothetical protein